MTYKKLQIASFLIFLLVVLILVLFIVKPFLTVLAFGTIMAILFWPVYNKLQKLIKSNTIASLLTVLLMLFILVTPIWFFGNVIFNEASNVYVQYTTGDLALQGSRVYEKLTPEMQTTVKTVIDQVSQTAQSFSDNALKTASGLLSNVFNFFLFFFLFFFFVFFLLRDGEHIKDIIMDISPIAKEQEYLLFKKVGAAVNGVVKGAFLTALIQGLVAMIGFKIFGVPQPIVWGLFTVVSALIPSVGTALSVIPAVIYLFITGHVVAAIGMAIWGALAIGTIDNLVGPKLIGSKTKLHPMLVLVSILGGIQFFGYVGFLLGPIVMAIFIALVEMYRTDFKDYLEN